MDMETLGSYNWLVMAPEFLILGTATFLALLDLFLPKRIDRDSFGWLAVGGTLLSFVFLLYLLPVETTSILFDTFVFDGFAKGFKLVLLIGGLLLLFLAAGSDKDRDTKTYSGEYPYLLLMALFGGMMITSSKDLITLFIGLELVSVSSYILVAMKKSELETNKAALTYIVNGSIATAVTLFGYSYLYGLSGTTNLTEMMKHLSGSVGETERYVFIIALLFIIVGVSFKLTTIPFSLWAADVYRGASTVITAFLSTVSKFAGFILFFRLVTVLFDERIPDFWDILSVTENGLIVLALLSMIFGTIMAIRQKNVKRLLAYSSIAHAGYILAGFIGFSVLATEAVLYYFLAYILMTIGAFAVVLYVTGGKEADISAFSGLYKRSPFLTVSFTVFLLSLASLPPTAGFIGKLKIIMSTLTAGTVHFFVAAVIIGTTILSYVYYFGLMAQLYFRPVKGDQTIPFKFSLAGLILFCVAATLIVGIFPNVANFDF